MSNVRSRMQPSRILALGVLLAWGVQVLLLWPLPNDRTETYRLWAIRQLQEQSIENQAQPSCDDKAFADARAEVKRFYQNIVDDPVSVETEFWVKWIRDFAMLLFGVAAATLMIRRARWWATTILLSSFLYFWRQGFLIHIYGLFFRDIADVGQFVSRLTIFTRRPDVLSSIVQFDLLIPFVLFVASGAAVSVLFYNWRLRRARNA